jgi:hypothetical protein
MNAATPAAAETKTDTKPKTPEVEAGVCCVIDLGEQKRKRVKKLRKGEGRLMEKVEDAIESLKEEGHLDASAQTVVVIVREEWSLRGMMSDDDDD